MHNAEGKLSEGIFSEILEIDGPAMGRFSDSCYRPIKSVLKASCCSQATLSIPTERCQILLFRSRMKSKRLTCHAAAYVPSAGPLPKRQFLPCRIEPHADGARPLAARRHPRLDQWLRPNWRSNFQPVPPVRSQAGQGPFAAAHGLLGSCPKLYASLQLGEHHRWRASRRHDG